MKITEDVRDYATQASAQEAEAGMAAKAEEFKKVGDFYVGS